MIKITKAILENFQSHTYTELDFSDFTAIIGATDSGKTSGLRGIKWALRNEPSGTDFIRRENVYAEESVIEIDDDGNEKEVFPVIEVKTASKCSVTVYLSNGKIIKRERGNRSNFYELTDENGEVMHLESFGVGPVKEVMEFHGMRDVDFFGHKESLNICEQLSTPFFLAESPAARATMIGKLANTDVIDLAMNNTLSEIRQKKAVVREHKKKLSSIKEDLKDMKDISKIENDLDDFKKSKEDMMRLMNRYVNLSRLKIQREQLISQKDNLEQIISRESEINDIILDIDNIIASNNKLLTIKKLNTDIKFQRADKARLQRIIGKVDLNEIECVVKNLDEVVSITKKVDTIKTLNKKIIADKYKLNEMNTTMSYENIINEAIKDLEASQIKLSETTRLKNLNDTRKTLLERKKKGEDVICRLQGDFDSKLKKYKESLLQNPHCPICMSEISRDRIDSIKDII